MTCTLSLRYRDISTTVMKFRNSERPARPEHSRVGQTGPPTADWQLPIASSKGPSVQSSRPSSQPTIGPGFPAGSFWLLRILWAGRARVEVGKDPRCSVSDGVHTTVWRQCVEAQQRTYFGGVLMAEAKGKLVGGPEGQAAQRGERTFTF